MRHVSFAQNSIQSSLKNKAEQFYTNANIIVGGSEDFQTEFYEILLSDEDNSISYKSFKKDYKDYNANLKLIRINDGQYVQSFLVDNNKYVIVFREYYGYNVYDMLNDRWLLKANNKQFLGQKGILITDQIIATYQLIQVHFYYIGSNNISNPQHIKSFTLDTDVDYQGMCCTEFIKNEKDTN